MRRRLQILLVAAALAAAGLACGEKEEPNAGSEPETATTAPTATTPTTTTPPATTTTAPAP